MASKVVKLRVSNQEIDAGLQSKITKDDLYGRVDKVVEQGGKFLERGYLLPDGTIFRKNSVSSTNVDPEGSPAESPEIFSAGQKVEPRPSSFDTGETLEPVSMDILGRFVTGDVYPLEATGLAPGLYRTIFNYRKSARPRDALILVREDATFLLVGQVKACPMVGRTVAYEFFDAAAAAEEASDPLDFSMM
jgi:hypothetical protein